jgi:hypothetical protein
VNTSEHTKTTMNGGQNGGQNHSLAKQIGEVNDRQVLGAKAAEPPHPQWPPIALVTCVSKAISPSRGHAAGWVR